MQTTNKKLAFVVAISVTLFIVDLLVTGYLTLDQAKITLIAIGSICGVFGLSDVMFDLLNIAFRVGAPIVALTPSTEDDKKLADLKALVEQLQLNMDNKAIGGMVMHWLDKNWKDIPEIFLPRGELDKTDETVRTTVTPFTTEIAGTSHSFPTVADDKIAG